MTAEMFLGIFVAVLLAMFVMWAFSVTVYKPISEWMMRRSGWKQTGPYEWTHSDDDVPDRAIVTVQPARVYPVWLRRSGDRLLVLVEATKGQWVVGIDVPWPGGDCEISHIWEGHTDRARPDPLSTNTSRLCKHPCTECKHRHDHDAEGLCSSGGTGVPCPCTVPHGNAGGSTATSSAM